MGLPLNPLLPTLPLAKPKMVLSLLHQDKICCPRMFAPPLAITIWVFNKIGTFTLKSVWFGKNGVFDLKLNKTVNMEWVKYVRFKNRCKQFQTHYFP